MLTPRSRIWWGPSLENPLDFAWAIDSFVPTRKHRPGSQRVRVPGVGYDVWSTGRDFHMAGVARYLEGADGADPLGVGSGWETPTGVEAFIDYAADGGLFTFVPDVVSAPDFTVPNCWLEEPFEPEPTPEEDGSLSQALRICNATVPFGQALRGIMLEFAAGASLTDPVAATITRASDATRRGMPTTSMLGPLGATDLANVLRDRHYHGLVRTALSEGLRVQLVPNPENIGNWTSFNGTPVRTGGQPDPFGGTNAYLIEDDDGAAVEGWQDTVAFTGDGEKCCAVFLRADTAAQSAFGIWDATAGVWRHLVRVTWTAGVPTLSTEPGQGSGTLDPPEYWGAGLWRLPVSATAVVAANTNRIVVLPAGATAAATGRVYLFGANAWDAVFPSSYQGPSLTTREDDLFLLPYTHIPQPIFVYLDLFDLGSASRAGVAQHYLNIGQTSPNHRLQILTQTTLGRIRVLHGESGNVTRDLNISGGVAYGDRLELLSILHPNGSVQIIGAKNGGADQDAGASAAFTPTSPTWSNQLVALGSVVGGGSHAYAGFNRLKIGPLTYAGRTINSLALARVA